jgi:hypothetical protein
LTKQSLTADISASAPLNSTVSNAQRFSIVISHECLNSFICVVISGLFFIYSLWVSFSEDTISSTFFCDLLLIAESCSLSFSLKAAKPFSEYIEKHKNNNILAFIKHDHHHR